MKLARLILALMSSSLVGCASDAIKPVTTNASPEAVKLLNYLYSVRGKGTLFAQHCNPLAGSTRLVTDYRTVGHYPAMFGQDFGFDAPGSWDGINFRQEMVDEAIRRANEGFIIIFMWHAVRPIDDEPVTFKESVQGKLTDAQWKELVTPGTALNERWKSQVDVIAWFLKQLRNANVPVLWRPYHEMNGDWFWWGKKGGDDGYKKLYRMLYDRLVTFHHLNNLLWVYGPNELNDNVDAYEKYYPGGDVVDVLATDVYRRGFSTNDYESLQTLAAGKPVAIGECGTPPSLQVLTNEPNWTYFMPWQELYGFGQRGNPQALRALFDSDRVISLEKLPWVKFDNGKPLLQYPVLK